MTTSPKEWGATASTTAPRITAPASSAFPSHRNAALALLNDEPGLSHKEAGFLGHVCVAPDLSDKQRGWLVKLLDRHAMPSLSEGTVS
jgi:hypothetical protein